MQVAQYVSDSSDEEIQDENTGIYRSQKQKRKRTKHWIKEGVSDNAAETEASIGNTWSKHYTNYSDNGRRVYYRCKKAKVRELQCSTSIHLLYHADNDKVSLYKSEDDHDHLDEK